MYILLVYYMDKVRKPKFSRARFVYIVIFMVIKISPNSGVMVGNPKCGKQP